MRHPGSLSQFIDAMSADANVHRIERIQAFSQELKGQAQQFSSEADRIAAKTYETMSMANIYVERVRSAYEAAVREYEAAERAYDSYTSYQGEDYSEYEASSLYSDLVAARDRMYQVQADFDRISSLMGDLNTYCSQLFSTLMNRGPLVQSAIDTACDKIGVEVTLLNDYGSL